MVRGGFLAVFLFVFIFSDASNSSLLSKQRILIGETSTNDSIVPVKDSPVPSPPPPPPPSPVTSSGDNGSDPKVDDPTKKKTTSPAPAKIPTPDPGRNDLANNIKKDEGKDPKMETNDPVPVPDKGPKDNPNPVPQKGSKQDPKPAHDTTPKEDHQKKDEHVPVTSSTEGGKENSKDAEKEKKSDNVPLLPNVDKESCDGVIKSCKVKDVIACIKNFDSGSKEVTILVQNTRDSILMAKLSADNDNKGLEIPEHQDEMVNVSLHNDKSNKITLNAGNEECVLHVDPLISENFFLRFPSREKLVTPINGAYLLIVTVLIFGGTWACCLVRKRKQRTGGGVPYQELEMGLPESASAAAVETAEGWDEVWDDDWGGENAVKSPGGHIAGSISSTGLTSRSTNKDGWENDWDD